MPIKQFCLFNLTAGNLTHRYLHGAMLDQSLADESNGQVLWTLTDNLGTVRDLVNSAGVVQNQIKYDSFGNVTSQTNASIKKRFGYTGRELDDETGLYYYRARYYDAVVGRFISEDPISFGGGDVNLYRYVGNNPVDKTDPSGLEEGVSIPDIIGNLIVGIGAGVLWLLTRPKQPQNTPKQDSQPTLRPLPTMIPTVAPTVTPTATPTETCDPNKPKKTCQEAFPKLIPCVELPKRYLFNSAKEAANTAFPDGEPEQGFFATKGPCGKNSQQNPKGYALGYHYNVKSQRTGIQVGSVGQCECCLENEGNPKSITKGAVLSSEPH